MSIQPGTYAPDGRPPGIDDDWAVLSEFGERFRPYFPEVASAGIRQVLSGWPTFVPDGRFIIGPVRGLKGFVMAGGCNAHGVSGSAGIGRHVVESLTPESASGYVKDLSPNRYLESAWSWNKAEREARHVYETYYAIGH